MNNSSEDSIAAQKLDTLRRQRQAVTSVFSHDHSHYRGICLVSGSHAGIHIATKSVPYRCAIANGLGDIRSRQTHIGAAPTDTAAKNASLSWPSFSTVENPARMMLLEHDQTGEEIKKICKLSNAFTRPAVACDLYAAPLGAF